MDLFATVIMRIFVMSVTVVVAILTKIMILFEQTSLEKDHYQKSYNHYRNYNYFLRRTFLMASKAIRYQYILNF